MCFTPVPACHPRSAPDSTCLFLPLRRSCTRVWIPLTEYPFHSVERHIGKERGDDTPLRASLCRRVVQDASSRILHSPPRSLIRLATLARSTWCRTLSKDAWRSTSMTRVFLRNRLGYALHGRMRGTAPDDSHMNPVGNPPQRRAPGSASGLLAPHGLRIVGIPTVHYIYIPAVFGIGDHHPSPSSSAWPAL